MKTLNEQIERLRELVRKCYGAVAGKNGTVPEVGERNMENLPAAIGSIKSASEVPKVKVSSLQVSNDCINEDGRWEGDVLIDTSLLKSINFNSCTNLKYIDCSYWNTSNFTSLFYLFRGCKNLESIVGLNQLDTSKVTNMGESFYGCSSIKELNLSNWDTSNVTNMGATFRDCNSIEELDVSNFDTSKVTKMGYLFSGVKSVKGYENLDTSNVVDMARLFGEIPNMRKLDLHNWDVRKVRSFWFFLYGTFYLEEIDITGWETPSVSEFDMITHGDRLWTLLGGKGIDEVLQNDIYTLKGIKVSFSLRSTIIDTASIVAVINGLADLTGQTSQTLTFGTKIGTRLDTEQIAGIPAKDYLAGKASAKNWTISY